MRRLVLGLFTVAVLAGCGGPERIRKLTLPREAVLDSLRLMAEGDELALAGKTHLALLKYLEATNLNPYHEVIFNKLAIAYTRLEQLDRAEKAAKRAIALEPEYPYAHNTNGIIQLARSLNQQAIGEFREAIRLEPEEANFYINLGHAQIRANHYEEGLEAYRQALTLDPEIMSKAEVIELSYQAEDDAGSERLYQLARVFGELGDREQCLEYLAKALSAGFSDGERLMGDSAFEPLLGDPEFQKLIDLYDLRSS